MSDEEKGQKIKEYSVTEFVSFLDRILRSQFAAVVGEVSNYKVINNAWVVFDLKDENSKIHCFIRKERVNVQVEDGMEIKVVGRPGVYSDWGQLTFYVDLIEPVGLGALKRAFELTKKKLQKEGLFDTKYKKSIPKYPEALGLVTSEDAAAYRDVIQNIELRWGKINIYFTPVHVQGTESVSEIVRALEWFNKNQPVDTIILTRGGGSLEDFQSFNSDRTCRAIFASRIPIIVGVGHERDETLADYVADKSVSTPTACAHAAVPDRQEVHRDLKYQVRDLHRLVGEKINTQQDNLITYLSRLDNVLKSKIQFVKHLQDRFAVSLSSFVARLVDQRKDLIERENLISKPLIQNIREYKTALISQQRRIQSLNPYAILKRGYSITYRRETKELVKAASQVGAGENIITKLAEGSLNSKVTK